MIYDDNTCGWNLAASFILSPTFQPDTACLSKILPIDFASSTAKSRETAKNYFGIEDMWQLNRTTISGSSSVSLAISYFMSSVFCILISFGKELYSE
jgi:hypothetical protein